MSSVNTDSLSISEFAQLFGFPEEAVRSAVATQRTRGAGSQAYFTISQLGDRWNCSRAQVYAILTASAAKTLNIGQGKARAKRLVPADTVAKIEKTLTEKMG
jgi:hypothetical protein